MHILQKNFVFNNFERSQKRKFPEVLLLEFREEKSHLIVKKILYGG